jgi:ribose-phosphate pyrophosphokinase
MDWKPQTILFPDEGANRRYCDQIAGSYDYGLAYATKKRDPLTGKLSGFEVPEIDPASRVMIVDDICDGGGTFIGIADKLGLPREQMALYVTHGIFSKGFGELMGRYRKIYTTNSFKPWPSDDELLTTYDCLPILRDRSQK